jgi:hypothetical protein
MAEFGQASARNQPDIACTNHRNAHGEPSKSVTLLTGKSLIFKVERGSGRHKSLIRLAQDRHLQFGLAKNRGPRQSHFNLLQLNCAAEKVTAGCARF